MLTSLDAVHNYSSHPSSALLFSYLTRRGRTTLRPTLRMLLAAPISAALYAAAYVAGEDWRFFLDPAELPAWLERKGWALAWDRSASEVARELGVERAVKEAGLGSSWLDAVPRRGMVEERYALATPAQHKKG